jgi:hypothetical protein
MESALVDEHAPTRDLIRSLRTQLSLSNNPVLPESYVWQTYVMLRRREDGDANDLLLTALRSLHRRRASGAEDLPRVDACPDEHRLTDDLYLAEFWRAYKRCIVQNRTGPAEQLLREIELRLRPEN